MKLSKQCKNISLEEKINFFMEPYYCQIISIRHTNCWTLSIGDNRHVRNIERAPRIRTIYVPMRILDNFVSYRARHSWTLSRRRTHWHYLVPSERLTRETFHSAVRANDTRAPGTFTEKKCAALRNPDDVWTGRHLATLKVRWH